MMRTALSNRGIRRYLKHETRPAAPREISPGARHPGREPLGPKLDGPVKPSRRSAITSIAVAPPSRYRSGRAGLLVVAEPRRVDQEPEIGMGGANARR